MNLSNPRVAWLVIAFLMIEREMQELNRNRSARLHERWMRIARGLQRRGDAFLPMLEGRSFSRLWLMLEYPTGFDEYGHRVWGEA